MSSEFNENDYSLKMDKSIQSFKKDISSSLNFLPIFSPRLSYWLSKNKILDLILVFLEVQNQCGCRLV